MKLVVSEKNIAARRIAEILAVGKPKADKVYTTPVYRFRRDGDDWVSIGLKGHIMAVDFSDDFGKWKLEDLTALVNAKVEKVPTEKGIIQSLKSLAKKADAVVIATDFDREGELIGSDAANVVRSAAPNIPISRARFSAITKGEIERAFSELGTIAEELAAAGEARQDIDLVWGAVLTRYLTLAGNKATNAKFGTLRSAGRVQTPTLKLVVDRERERDAFVAVTYWQVKAGFIASGDEFSAMHATDRFKDEAEARRVMEAVADERTGTVTSAVKAKRTQVPPAPFNTTSLMAAAAAEGMSPAATMRVAESLYMDGLLSYPRVDNTVYPPSLDLRGLLETLKAVPFYREHVGRILGSGPLHATRGNKETTDHPPIHPTGAADPDKVTGQHWKIYNLVSRRFLATLSDPAVIEGTKATIEVASEPFMARGDVLVVPGYRAVYPYGMKKDEQLPALAEGGTVEFTGAALDEKQTQPPARFSQGRLLQEMEKLGLGTKSTRHNIIQNLYDRNYVTGDPIEPTCQGITVIEALSSYADRITTPDMTSDLEADMDRIAEASVTRERVVEHSREMLEPVMKVLLDKTDDVGVLLKKAIDEDATVGKCPVSGDDLRIRYSPKTRGWFVGCSGYPECSVTYSLPEAARYEAVSGECPECGAPRVRLIRFRQRPMELCLNQECATRKEPEVIVGQCPTIVEDKPCGGALRVIRSPRTLKRFVRCSNYETCHTSYPLPQSGDLTVTGESCEPCGAPIVIVTTRRGPWRICIDPDCPSRTPSDAAAKAKPKAKAPARKRPAAKRGAASAKTSGGRSRKTAAEGA